MRLQIYRFKRTLNIALERFWMKLAWLMPKQLVYWCAIRLMSAATTGNYGETIVPELTAMEALRRWTIDG